MRLSAVTCAPLEGHCASIAWQSSLKATAVNPDTNVINPSGGDYSADWPPDFLTRRSACWPESSVIASTTFDRRSSACNIEQG